MNNLVRAVTLTLIGALPLTAVRSQSLQPAVEWIGQSSDWQPQDYFDSRGITAVRLENGRLVLTARLLPRDGNFSKGEVLLDLKFFPELDCQVPVDFSGRELAVEFEVPDALVSSGNDPSRLYLFAKDKDYASFYSPATNVTRGGRFRLTMRFTESALREGYSEAPFNPALIRQIGAKVEAGTDATNRFEGSLYISSVNVNPPLPASASPNLPVSAPLPVLLPGDKIEAKDGALYLNDKKWFVAGANWQVTEYGQNFGVTAWFPFGNGVARHSNFTRINLDYARRAGIKLLRVGLLDDGRVMFDRDGRVVGYDETFKGDVRTLLNLAQQAGLRVEFTLCDFLLAGKEQLLNGVWLRGRRGVVADAALRADFRAAFLAPFLRDFGGHPALFGFDLINEPEWVVRKAEGGRWEDYTDPPGEPPKKAEVPVPREALTAFINECAGEIRRLAPGKLITVGVSASAAALVSGLASLDYLAPHHYHTMDSLSVYVPAFAGRAWLLEEFPTKYAPNAVPGSLRAYFDSALALRGSGAMFWNLTPGIDPETCLCAERPARLAELRNWADVHAAEIHPPLRPWTNVSATDFKEKDLAGEMIVTGFGSGLATATAAAGGLPLPTALAGTRVAVKDNTGVERLAGLLFVSPTQINYVIPGGTATGAALITVTSGDGSVSAGAAQMVPVSPGLFAANADGRGVAAGYAVHVAADGAQQRELLFGPDPMTNRLVPKPIDLGPDGEQVFLELYGTGFRKRSVLAAVQVTVGGLPMQVLYAGEAPGYAGLDQVNIRLARSLGGRGEVDLELIVDGQAANKVKVHIR
jgi:uncharacterized protein (TIGR03437 family)